MHIYWFRLQIDRYVTAAKNIKQALEKGKHRTKETMQNRESEAQHK